MTPNKRKRAATAGAGERHSRRFSGGDPEFGEETLSPKSPPPKMSRNSVGKFVRSEATPPQDAGHTVPSPSKTSPRHQKPSPERKRRAAALSTRERPPRCQVEEEVVTPTLPQSPSYQDFLTPRLPSHAQCSQSAEGETPLCDTPRRSRGRPPKSLSRPSQEDSGKPSPIKTRRIKAVSSAPHCTLCKKPKKDSLKPCSKCNLNYHLSACLKYKEPMAEIAAEKEDWLCPKCTRCSGCSEFIEDAQNKECVQCLSAWHGRCFKGHSSEDGDLCKRCNVNRSPSRVAFLEPSTSTAPATPPKARGKPKGWRLFPSQKPAVVNDARFKNPSGISESEERLMSARAAIWDSHVDEFQETREQRAASRSPAKPPKVNKKPKRPIPLSTDEDLNLFDEVLQQWWDERKEQKKQEEEEIPKQTKDKWVYMGKARKMKALYDSPFPDDVLASEHIYICPFCLTATGDTDCYRIHRNMCTWRHPPGNEIYRDDGLSFFEVDGALHATYCRNLCLLSKMFISSKTLHHEVATFRFYILTEHTPDGCCLVGYFSKEDKPSRNNNLSCLLTLPGQSRRGYGKLLIELSYELSRREVKIGCPEHPLSDLGLYAYRGYWRSRIVQYLRSARNASQTSIKQMALDTRISPTDIVNQLMLDALLVYTDGNYFIKTGKRAFKFPLSTIRRRVIDQKKLIWTPPVDVSHLDPTKLNYYA